MNFKKLLEVAPFHFTATKHSPVFKLFSLKKKD